VIGTVDNKCQALTFTVLYKLQFEKLGHIAFMAGYRNGTVPPRFNPCIRLSGSAVDLDIPIQQALQGRMLLTLE